MATQVNIDPFVFTRQSKETSRQATAAPTHHHTWKSEKGIHPGTAELKPFWAVHVQKEKNNTIETQKLPATFHCHKFKGEGLKVPKHGKSHLYD